MSKHKNNILKATALFAANFAVGGFTLYSNLAVADVDAIYASPIAINAWGYCYVVTNYASGYTQFVPTTNAGEWTNIINNHGGLTFSSCGIGQGDAGCGFCGDGGGGGGGGGGG